MVAPAKKPASPYTGAAYFGNRFLSHAQEDLARMAECCDYVVHTFSESDLYYHKAALSSIFTATRRRGLEAWVDPWGLGGVFGGEALSKFLLDHPQDWQVLSNGQRVPAACLNSRAFGAFMKEWLLNTVDMGAQVAFWDEPHPYFHWNLEWEGVYSCTCAVCSRLYRDQFGGPMPPRLDASAYEFRRKTITEFLGTLMALARQKGMRNALCLYAFEGYKEYERLWKDLAALPDLDIFGCDPYWRWRPRQRNPRGHVKHYSERVVEATRPAGKGSQIWIQAMRLPQGTENEIEIACQAAAQEGVTHLAAWSYDGGALLDTVLAEDPARVWAEVARIFKQIRDSR
jgi:hypothetical protein